MRLSQTINGFEKAYTERMAISSVTALMMSTGAQPPQSLGFQTKSTTDVATARRRRMDARQHESRVYVLCVYVDLLSCVFSHPLIVVLDLLSGWLVSE